MCTAVWTGTKKLETKADGSFLPLAPRPLSHYRRHIEYLSVADWKALLQVDIIKTTKFKPFPSLFVFRLILDTSISAGIFTNRKLYMIVLCVITRSPCIPPMN